MHDFLQAVVKPPSRVRFPIAMKLFPVGLLVLFAFPALSQQPAPKASGVAVIQAYAGTWKVEIEHLDTKFSKAGKDSSTLENHCWLSDEYYSCHQYVNGKGVAFLVFTYTGKDDVYHSYVIPSDGNDAHLGTLLIKGDTWTYPWEDKDDSGKHYYFQVVNVWSSPDTIEFRQEFSEDKAHWTLSAKGHEVRQK